MASGILSFETHHAKCLSGKLDTLGQTGQNSSNWLKLNWGHSPLLNVGDKL